MKLIIAGSRTLNPSNGLIDGAMALHKCYPSEIVSGGAKGVDRAAQLYCHSEFGYRQATIFEADWETHGKAAGPIRNKQMAEYADALLLIWDGESRGSASMKREMEKLNKPIYEVILKCSTQTSSSQTL